MVFCLAVGLQRGFETEGGRSLEELRLWGTGVLIRGCDLVDELHVKATMSHLIYKPMSSFTKDGVMHSCERRPKYCIAYNTYVTYVHCIHLSHY